METDLYRWFPIKRGQDIPNAAILAGRTSTDGDVYVGRNDALEVGKLNLKRINGVQCTKEMYNIWCHSSGSSDHGTVLVLKPNCNIQWKPFKTRDALPLGAVFGGETRKDGKVYVARDVNGGVGKLNIRSDGTIHNLWVHGYFCAWKEGDILVVSPGEQAWNPAADCGGSSASARAAYLQSADGLYSEDAQLQVMSEYPSKFKFRWNPAAPCGGIAAEGRSKWLQDNEGLSEDLAQWKVMTEFPLEFSAQEIESSHKSCLSWDPEATCDGVRADERADCLKREQGISIGTAQLQVMKQYPTLFGLTWRPDAKCGEHSAQERSLWLQTEKKMKEDEAQKQVMNEFEWAFV